MSHFTVLSGPDLPPGDDDTAFRVSDLGGYGRMLVRRFVHQARATNRADLLEPALAARPGRVDQAVHVDLPDRESRRRLVELYRGSLEVDLSRIDDVLDGTDGVTASFIKELLRRAAVIAAERAPDGDLRVTADDVDASLAELLDTSNQMTRSVLGYRSE